MNTKSWKSFEMDMSTWKSDEVCMACRKPASSQTNYSPNDLPLMDITNVGTLLDSGDTSGGPSSSLSSLTILASNMSANNMSIISTPPSNNTTNTQKIGMANYIVESPSNGIMPKASSIYPCQDTSKPPYTNSNTQRHRAPNMQPIYGKQQQMAPLPDATAKLPPERIQRIQTIVGTLLYYARAVDSTQLVALGTIATQQANATIKTEKATAHLLDYCHTHSDAVL
jgi:hypothetical protein